MKVGYQDIRLSTKATESPGIRCNGKFLAVPWQSGGGGTLAVIPVEKTGRLPSGIPLITGHSGPILDFEFNPFDDNMIATSSEDLTVKLWNIPDGGLTEHMKDPLLTLEGHGKKVMFSTFSPSAAHVIATTAFDCNTKIWNISEQEEMFNITLPETVWGMSWNYNGSLLACTCKDKRLRILDPRQSKSVAETRIHEGVKPSKVCWVGNPGMPDQAGKIVTTGFSSQAERQIGVWDMRMFGAEDTDPLNMLILDQGTGSLYPTFDEGTQMLYVAGKGDGNVRYFECTPEDPYLHFLSQYSAKDPQKGFCFLPKKCVDTTKHEVMRGLKLDNACVHQITFTVPRKAEAFQEDLFPDGPAGVPAMTPEEWATGGDKPPILRSMKPGEGGGGAKKDSASGGMLSMKDLKKQLQEALAKSGALEKENALLKKELAALKGK